MFSCAIIILTFSAVATSTPDYYWRPFDGTLPTDALILDTDTNGTENIFIGHAPVWGGGLYVGTLYEGKKQIIVTGDPHDDDHPNGVHIVENNIEILCTRNSELFIWIPTTTDAIHTIPYLLVQGGYEDVIFTPLYVGRTDINGKSVIGKVIGHEGGTYGYTLCVYNESGNIENRVTSYDVLAYLGMKKHT